MRLRETIAHRHPIGASRTLLSASLEQRDRFGDNELYRPTSVVLSAIFDNHYHHDSVQRSMEPPRTPASAHVIYLICLEKVVIYTAIHGHKTESPKNRRTRRIAPIVQLRSLVNFDAHTRDGIRAVSRLGFVFFAEPCRALI